MQQIIIEHLSAEGYPVTEVVADGKIRRFRLDDKDTKLSGWYKAYTNYANDNGEPYIYIIYGSWKSDERKKFSGLTRKLSSAQNRLHKDQYEKAKKEAEDQRAAEHERVAKECAEFWETLEERGASPYLDRKKISGDLGIRYRELGQYIYVPVRDIDGKIWSLEEINAEGKKLSFPGGRKVGGFHIIGTLGETIYLAEGFATAASIHLATGNGCICTFGTGQFKAVAGIFRKHYPDKKIVICGDLNHPSKKSASEKLAEDAAKNVTGSVIFPVFKNSTDEDFPTDFNDLHSREGLEEVKRQVEGPMSLEPVPLTGKEIAMMAYPDEDDNGRRPGTIENVAELIRRLSITVKYNVISKSIDYRIPGEKFLLHNQENNSLTVIGSHADRCRINKGNISAVLEVIAGRNPFNPVIAWIESEAWDGTSRLQDFYDTVDAVDNSLKEKLMRRWLISAVAAAYKSDGISAHGILVFQGAQYLGKTKWFRSLVPNEMSDLIADGVTLKPDDKDSVFQAIQRWLVELGELDATFRKTDISQLKSFVPRDRDTMRRPFAAKDSHFPRQTVFFGSVNDQNYLVDDSGNRRFWTVECLAIDHDHTVNMQQLWAEIATFYKAGENWRLTKEENALLNLHNENYQQVSPIEELIEAYYDWDEPESEVLRIPCNATQVCIAIGITNPKKSDANTAAKAVRKISGKNWDRRKRFWLPLKKARIPPGTQP